MRESPVAQQLKKQKLALRKARDVLHSRLRLADVRDFPKLDPKILPLINQVSENSYKKAFQDFNQMLGWPYSRIINERVPMTPYQLEYDYLVEAHHSLILDKTRKGGFTDTRLRSMARNIFTRYQGHDSMIIAGNELVVAREVLDRFDELFQNGVIDKDGKHWDYGDVVMRYVKSPQPIVEFYNGARVFCFAVSKTAKRQAFRGPDDIISIFFTEAAHTGMDEDTAVYTALSPLLANRTDGDFVLESTPNGKRGFYYNIWMDALEKKNEFYPYLVTWQEAVKYGVIPQEFIDKEKRNPNVDFEQEYEGKFTTSKRATFDEQMIEEAKKVLGEHKSINLSRELGYE